MRTPILVALLVTGCMTPTAQVPDLASSRVVADFDTYRLRRVGLLPFTGDDLTGEEARHLQASFFTEASAVAPFEIVPLDTSDVAEIPASDPFRRGVYKPRTIIDVARRFHLDAVMVGTVTDRRLFSPPRIGLQLDMVVSETGMVIWNSTVHLDGAQQRVRNNIKLWASIGQGDLEEVDWKLCLLSPRRFAQFATYHLAQQIAE
ncbi:MAG: hypothetical protein ACI8QZ_000007 [Chlamydiales bacterium]|jgi:hypothetical protein